MPDVRIGISGWTYAPWRGVFFPPGLRQKDELAYAAERVRTIEINGTFYCMQRPASFGVWYEQTPEDFEFAVKAPRFITHMKKLKDVVAPVANFFASGVLRLNRLRALTRSQDGQMRGSPRSKFPWTLTLKNPTTAGQWACVRGYSCAGRVRFFRQKLPLFLRRSFDAKTTTLFSKPPFDPALGDLPGARLRRDCDFLVCTGPEQREAPDNHVNQAVLEPQSGGESAFATVSARMRRDVL